MHKVHALKDQCRSDDHAEARPREGLWADAADLNFVKAIGKIDSTTRTAEQTEIASFWYELAPPGWTRIANTVITQKRVGTWQSARILALVNFALADGYIAGFAAKYRLS